MNSKIILARGIKVDREYSNVLSYTEQQMVNLCLSNQISQADDYSFIRQNKNSISTHFTYSQCLQANYIAFQNTDYSGKWFFAWIDDVIYKSNGTTEIQYTIDYWSTWFDYWQKKPCFVVREHVNDDTIGLHTIPENIDVGDLVCDYYRNDNNVSVEEWFWIVVASNYDPTTSTSYAGLSYHDGYPQGCQWFAWHISPINPITEFNSLNTWLASVASAQHVADIQSMFVLPDIAINENDVDQTTHKVASNLNKKSPEVQIDKSRLLSFYDYDNVKNNKLYCYPYNFLRVSNNQGSYNDYMIEDFSPDEENPTKVIFRYFTVACQGFASQLNPVNYKGQNFNYDENLQQGKFPTLSWSTDSFTNWISLQGQNIQVGAVLSAISSSAQLTGGNYVGGTVSTGSSLANIIGQIRTASMQPNTAQGNVNAGDVGFAWGTNCFRFMKMRAKKEYLQVIDDYFSRSGYKVNVIKEPNIIGRRNWNYVEIAGTEQVGYGDVPSNAMDAINNACRKGVTIWHNHTNLGNFSLDNSIV